MSIVLLRHASVRCDWLKIVQDNPLHRMEQKLFLSVLLLKIIIQIFQLQSLLIFSTVWYFMKIMTKNVNLL
jgi:hypothetical protein